MDETYKKELEKQQYRFIGDHSAVKVCSWTKKALTGQGHCYKQKFYGIESHRCCQISVTVNYCDQDCIFCWRKRYQEPFTTVDDPKKLVDNAIAQHSLLLSGMGGHENINRKKLEEAKDPNQFAISLTGETLHYPRLSELIRELKRRGCSSFVVTNGQLPEVMERMEPPSQLYISLDAPNEDIYRKVCRPMNNDGWQRLNRSLEVLKDLRKKTRTTIRVTLVKGENMAEPENYAKLIEKAEPHFLEVKAYMFVGNSRLKLSIKNMPRHHEIVEFAKDLEKHSRYRIIDEQPESRVVLMMKDDNKRFLK
ncbi:MAG: 4-demethylwyosine synthase TYW1 [Candidatus Woesearchaeota archaeon]